VKVKHGNREVNSFVVYPEVKKKATAVIVIHEINGLTGWVQSLTGQLAEAGYVAIAPDFLSRMGQAIRDLTADQITADLNAVSGFVSKLPAANGKVVAGFCWGGAQAFRYATNSSGIKASFVFYGAPPMDKESIDKNALARNQAPVYGYYAGNDARINATLPATIEAMKELKKTFEPVIYEGAGHGFMRAGDAPAPEMPAPKGEKKLTTKQQPITKKR
jgi:carboxymethylenebutenolidase